MICLMPCPVSQGRKSSRTPGAAQGWRSSLNPKTKMGARTQAALEKESWDYVVLQEMSNGPITAPDSFFRSVRLLCEQIRRNGAVPVLYATWAYQKGSDSLTALGLSYEEMARRMSKSMGRLPRKTMPCWPQWETAFMSFPKAGICMLPTASSQ